MARHRASTLWRTQNFLRDPRLVERLVARSDIRHGDVVYDLGAGEGALTAALCRRAARVIAVEKDPSLCARLRDRFADRPNVVVRRADILRHALPRAEHVVFASLPFDVTSAMMRRLTTADVPPREAYLVLQREAAARYLGRPRQTLAALLIAPWFSLRVLHRFERGDFAPSPGVDAVFVRLHKRGPPLVPPADAQRYRDLVVTGFATWRPTIGTSLSRALGPRVAVRLLRDAEIEAAARPSAIPTHGWLRLYRHFAQLPDPVGRTVAGAEARLRRQQSRIHPVHRTRTPRDALGMPTARGRRRHRATAVSNSRSGARRSRACRSCGSRRREGHRVRR